MLSDTCPGMSHVKHKTRCTNCMSDHILIMGISFTISMTLNSIWTLPRNLRPPNTLLYLLWVEHGVGPTNLNFMRNLFGKVNIT